MAVYRRWDRGVALVAAGLLSVCAPAAPAAAHEAAPPKQQQQLLEQGQALMQQGRLDDARSAIERAIAMGHSPQAELADVQLAVRLGEYRHALALAAHVAGEEGRPGPAAALYASLLDHGGQVALAQQVAARLPAGVAAPGVAVPGAGVAATAACTAVLLDDGRSALTPIACLRGGTSIDLIDTHGVSRPAEVVQRDETCALALLRLATPLPAAARWAGVDPFAGSPGSLVGFDGRPSASGVSALPTLRPGFVGALRRDDVAREPGIGLDGADGAALLDARGRVAGIVVHDAARHARWWPLSALRRAFPDAPWPQAGAGVAARGVPSPLDAVYEQALGITLRVQ